MPLESPETAPGPTSIHRPLLRNPCSLITTTPLSANTLQNKFRHPFPNTPYNNAGHESQTRKLRLHLQTPQKFVSS
ncbi:hypothetical protein VTJ04DRAFT_3486 [Mycothermus thermophilus]|uniref:uncharacterized protein n=1 Tax=Humicola insolens TaxID=85995 RepID=UPI0037423159